MEPAPCVIRALAKSDSPAISGLLVRLAQETPYVLLSPAESRDAAKSQHASTAAVLASANQRIFVAEEGAELAGFIALTQGLFAKNRHAASLMIGVLRARWGRDVGRNLMDTALGWARERGVWRIELSVMADNARALRFYEAHGFQREGVKRSALVVDGEAVDELMLARIEER